MCLYNTEADPENKGKIHLLQKQNTNGWNEVEDEEEEKDDEEEEEDEKRKEKEKTKKKKDDDDDNNNNKWIKGRQWKLMN